MYHAKSSCIRPETVPVFAKTMEKASIREGVKSSIRRPLSASSLFRSLDQPSYQLSPPVTYHLIKNETMHCLIGLAFFYIENSITINAAKCYACISSLKTARLTDTSGRAPQGSHGANVPPPVKTGEYWASIREKIRALGNLHDLRGLRYSHGSR